MLESQGANKTWSVPEDAAVNTTPLASMSRRSFLAVTAVAPLATMARLRAEVPVGLELYSVRDELAKDLFGTVRAVAEMGYQTVEF